MIKYELIPEQLLYEGTVTADQFFHPDALDESIITRTHLPSYWKKLKHLELSRKEARAIGFPISERLVQRGRHIAQGTIDCAKYALQYGIAMNVAGGTHHSFTYKGEGFCLLNDIAIAANYLLDQQLARRILVVDLDVHQGNGTAEIFRTEERVFTFSMHGANNYPLRKEQSDLDIGLADKTVDAPYLKQLKDTLPKLLDLHRADFVFYLAGVDVLESDKLGRLSLSLQGCKARDEYVLRTCRDRQLPVAVSMGGGYSVRIADIVEAHANTFRVAQDILG